ncbi:MAG: hypothetical protein AAF846_22885 [Chloroflexota bacterium]
MSHYVLRPELPIEAANTEKVRIVHLEDMERWQEIVSRLIEQHFSDVVELTTVSNIPSFISHISALSTIQQTIIILDLSIPFTPEQTNNRNWAAIEWLKQTSLLNEARYPNIKFLIISGFIDEEVSELLETLGINYEQILLKQEKGFIDKFITQVAQYLDNFKVLPDDFDLDKILHDSELDLIVDDNLLLIADQLDDKLQFNDFEDDIDLDSGYMISANMVDWPNIEGDMYNLAVSLVYLESRLNVTDGLDDQTLKWHVEVYAQSAKILQPVILFDLEYGAHKHLEFTIIPQTIPVRVVEVKVYCGNTWITTLLLKK